MIKGPWPMSSDGTRYEIPLNGPRLTPMFLGERVALRVSDEDHSKLRRRPGVYGVITDLDTMKHYTLTGRPCSAPGCFCDAEIAEMQTGTGGYMSIRDVPGYTCDVCGDPKCAPIEHIDKLLTDAEALHLAKIEAVDGAPRARLLAKWIINHLPVPPARLP
jgi:hypothetical protein